jgi:CRP/FNR family cyclic AMP-dependent transcriptional regulator
MPEIRTYTEILMFLDEEPRAHAEGSLVFEEGEIGREMYIVREGSVTLRHGGADIETLGPGAFFGEMALIDAAPRSASAVAGAGLKLAVVDERLFKQLVQKVPGFALELMRMMAQRLRRELER